jgi:hypothetical protein
LTEIRCVVSSHSNPSLSGVARFNRELARQLGIPCLGLERPVVAEGPVLLSVKLEDSTPAEQAALADVLAHWKKSRIGFDVFFHTFSGLPIEERCVLESRLVYAGNAEIRERLSGHDKKVVAAWCPPLVNGERRVQEGALNIFSFGMAHKIQRHHYLALHDLLEEARLDYELWVSTAFHEKAQFGDFDSISEELRGVMGPRVQFLGFLSDEAVNYFLGKAHLFVSFFPGGVRANNTSVAAAMALGCPVLTNTDRHSPEWMEHGRTVLDIARLETADLELPRLEKIGACGAAVARERWDWASLHSLLRENAT